MPADPRPSPGASSAPPTAHGCGHGCGCSHNAPAAAPTASGVSRRSFIKTVGVSAAATSITASGEARAAAIAGEQPADGPSLQGPDPVDITLSVNGQPLKLKVEPATTLLEALRLHANLTGSKEICDRGACGGCSVIIDGQLINACMMLALDAVGTQITTIEGLAKNGKLDPVQESFVRHDALQCGYCTPGLVMACRALLNDTPKPTLDQIRRGLSGNICRCGTYTNIFNAALEASGQSPIMDQKGA
jgi:aerobic-type carbon monoxide dehydrogenase small subunit (CoxS/CutS family)